jgi:hypothetical protein
VKRGKVSRPSAVAPTGLRSILPGYLLPSWAAIGKVVNLILASSEAAWLTRSHKYNGYPVGGAVSQPRRSRLDTPKDWAYFSIIDASSIGDREEDKN